MHRALCSSDNCYNIANFRGVGHVCKTNLPSNTAMRGFGAPQSILIMENIINDVAAFLGVRPDKVYDFCSIVILRSLFVIYSL